MPTSDDPADLYYHHSGRKGIAFPLAVLLGVPITIILSALYAYIVVYCPVVGYVNLLFLGGFVTAVGYVIHQIAKIGKCRSDAMMIVIGFLLGCVALYFSWLFFLKALIGDVRIVTLIFSPAQMWQYIVAINSEGWWGPSGLAQWALVATEALVIIGGLTLAGASSLGEQVFCEQCNVWCKPFEKMHLRKDASSATQPASNLELLGLEETSADDYPRYDADIVQCESCEQMQAIRFYNVRQETDDGELKVKREQIPGVLVKRG